MELKEMIEVMQHYEDGGEVEFRVKDDNSDIWENIDSPSWGWPGFDYRIKEQRQKVTIEKWLIRVKKDVVSVVETSNIDDYCFEKIKLLETYEVEI